MLHCKYLFLLLYKSKFQDSRLKRQINLLHCSKSVLYAGYFIYHSANNFSLLKDSSSASLIPIIECGSKNCKLFLEFQPIFNYQQLVHCSIDFKVEHMLNTSNKSISLERKNPDPQCFLSKGSQVLCTSFHCHF